MNQKNKQMIQANRTLIRVLTVIGLIITVALAICIYQIGYTVIMLHIKDLLIQIGFWGPILFILIQLGQVVYPVIPGGITLVVGQLIFGPFWGFIYSLFGVTLGSIVNFHLARKFGRTFVQAFVSEETYLKYYGWLTKGKRFEVLLASAFALPGFPDDFLCMIAGLTKMTFQKFMIIYWIFKPATLYLYGAGGATLADWALRTFFPFGT